MGCILCPIQGLRNVICTTLNTWRTGHYLINGCCMEPTWQNIHGSHQHHIRSDSMEWHSSHTFELVQSCARLTWGSNHRYTRITWGGGYPSHIHLCVFVCKSAFSSAKKLQGGKRTVHIPGAQMISNTFRPQNTLSKHYLLPSWPFETSLAAY